MNEAGIRAVIARLTQRPTGGLPVEPAAPERLAALICAKPWRRSRVDAATGSDIRAKVTAARAAGAPIEFAVPFGGYKGALQPSAPHPDWAELFWIGYLRRYAESFAAAHPAGVLFSLSYFHGVLGAINGLPLGDQDAYIAGLRPLLAYFSDARIGFRLVDLSEHFGGAAEAAAAIERRFQDRRAAIEAGGVPALALQSAARNLLRRPGDPAPAQPEIVASALRCVAMESLEERRRFNKFSTRIQITHIRGAALALHLGSCATSVMQPWVGTGVLEGDGAGGWRPRILNGAGAGIDARLDVRHPLENIAPALRSIGICHRPAWAGGKGGGGDE
ncbi:hypothetical protein [Ancylobacter sp. FA202]|uniref:hypothetical protein n=1 Tax=Ancylobacter sp. FA202 TaxID=1111106 RepID=UPI00037656A2|nr:hypothetical protein [Ancylobacter sp. FA202]